MAATFTFYSLLSLLGFLTSLTIEADPTNYTAHYCTNTTTYAPNTRFQRNLNVLLSSLASNSSQEGGYYMTVMGFGTTDAVNGLFLCRGDIITPTCQDCVNAAAKEIKRRCPNQTEALIWFDQCMLRYTNRYFRYGSVVPGVNLDDEKSISSRVMEGFNRSLFSLLNDLATEAAKSQSAKKLATGQEKFSSSQTIYALEQCTEDLTSFQCETCLRNAIGTFPTCCDGKQGARALIASCNVRYELYPFYNITATSAGPLAPSSSSGRKIRTIVIIVVPVTVSVIIICFCGFFLLRRSKKNNRTDTIKENFRDEITPLDSLQFNLATIEAATNKFSQLNKIGKGGFGEVYKGMLPDGREIAVKKLSRKSGQGAIEFKTEISLIAKLQHRNLVALFGFCLQEEEKMLIYEYVSNKSLDYFLFDFKKQRILNWLERYKIIGGIARGILYLHEHSRLKVIHRDLKPSNVLLDDNMNPKISDFGLARIVAVDQDQESTNRIVGTYGYMSPEYAMHGQFSEKSDVYSFGVIVIEIISGKRNARSHKSKDLDDLLCYTWRQWRNQTPLQILDPNLKESYSQSEVNKCIQIGLLCVQEIPDDRPTMAKVNSYLNSLLVELPFPREPALLKHIDVKPNMVEGGTSSTNNSVPSSLNDMSKSSIFPR